MPFINLHVAADGAISPCCEFDGSIGHLNHRTLSEAWNSRELDEIRRCFLNEQPVKACWKCFDRDAGENYSMRQQVNRFVPRLV